MTVIYKNPRGSFICPQLTVLLHPDLSLITQYTSSTDSSGHKRLLIYVQELLYSATANSVFAEVSLSRRVLEVVLKLLTEALNRVRLSEMKTK